MFRKSHLSLSELVSLAKSHPSCFCQVWCDDGYPRLVQRPLEIALTGKMSKRCACFNKDELGQPGLEVYEGCEYFAKLCRL